MKTTPLTTKGNAAMATTTWRKLLAELMIELEDHGPIIKFACDDPDREFDDGFGLEEGSAFTAWTNDRVYFPICYDGAEYVGSVERNPEHGGPTNHQGGG